MNASNTDEQTQPRAASARSEAASAPQRDTAPDGPHTHPSRQTAAERFATAVWGPLLGLAVNLILVLIKAIAGIVSGSVALLADAGHSGADAANNLLVLGSLIYSRRPADETHPYGHDRAEVLAAMGSAFLLMGAGLFFGWDSIQKLIVGAPEPSLLALWVAIGTLAVKVVVVRVESVIAYGVGSQAILADARDSLADIFSSLAVIGGVIGAHFGQSRLDGAGGLVIAFLILGTAVQIGARASHELLEHNLDAALLEQVRAAATSVPDVRAVAAVTGREHGSDVLVQISIEVDPQMTVDRAAALAEQVRQAIYTRVPSVGDAIIELNTNHVARLHQELR